MGPIIGAAAAAGLFRAVGRPAEGVSTAAEPDARALVVQMSL